MHTPDISSILSFETNQTTPTRDSDNKSNRSGGDTMSVMSRGMDNIMSAHDYDGYSFNYYFKFIHSTTFVQKYRKDKIYLSVIIFSEKKEIMLNAQNLLPSIQIYGDEEDSGEMFDNFATTSEVFMWARQTCLDWEPQIADVDDPANPFSFTLASLSSRHAELGESTQLKAITKFKKKYVAGAMRMQEVFRLKNFGVMNR